MTFSIELFFWMAVKSCSKDRVRTLYLTLRVLGKLTFEHVQLTFEPGRLAYVTLFVGVPSYNLIKISLSCVRYLKPKHLSTSEFLSDVTTPEGVRYLQPGFTRLNREDFVASFLLSPTFRDIRRVVHSGDSVQEHWVQVSDNHNFLCFLFILFTCYVVSVVLSASDRPKFLVSYVTSLFCGQFRNL